MASGWIAQSIDHDWAGAEADYKHALAINPSLNFAEPTRDSRFRLFRQSLNVNR